MQIQKRKIQHPRFQNISSVVAIKNLQREDTGEFYFRPSSKGTNHLTLTWKFHDTNIVHIDIEESEKAVGANIGSRLKISSEHYDNLQEIVERYITPCNRSVREVTMHPKFHKCGKLDEIDDILKKEKGEDATKIPYRFSIFDDYPQYLVLAYIPKKDTVKEYIKVKPRGFFFHQQYQYPFQNLINWFKKSFKSREYQSRLRRASSPQRIGAGIPRPLPALRPSEVPDDGMQVDQTNEDGFKQERGRRGGDDSKSKGGWGADAEMTDARSDRRPPRDGGGGRACFKCGKEGHFARECPEAGEGGGQRGGRPGGGSRACFKCGEEGHMARECPNPDTRGENGRPPFQKRQRRDDNDDNQGGNGNAGWNAGGAPADEAGFGNTGGGWGDAAGNSQPEEKTSGGGAWGAEAGDAARSSENKTPEAGGAWGAKQENSHESNGGGGW